MEHFSNMSVCVIVIPAIQQVISLSLSPSYLPLLTSNSPSCVSAVYFTYQFSGASVPIVYQWLPWPFLVMSQYVPNMVEMDACGL